MKDKLKILEEQLVDAIYKQNYDLAKVILKKIKSIK